MLRTWVVLRLADCMPHNWRCPTQVVPLLRKCSLAGHAEFKTRDAVFSDNEVAPDMLLGRAQRPRLFGFPRHQRAHHPRQGEASCNGGIVAHSAGCQINMLVQQHDSLLACWTSCLCRFTK